MNNNNSNKNTQQHHYGLEFSLFVGDLPFDCSDDKLQRLFQSKYKSVKRVQSKYHRHQGRSFVLKLPLLCRLLDLSPNL